VVERGLMEEEEDLEVVDLIEAGAEAEDTGQERIRALVK